VEEAFFGESMAGPRAVLDVSGDIVKHRRVKPVPRTFGIRARRGPACHPRNCRESVSKWGGLPAAPWFKPAVVLFSIGVEGLLAGSSLGSGEPSYGRALITAERDGYYQK